MSAHRKALRDVVKRVMRGRFSDIVEQVMSAHRKALRDAVKRDVSQIERKRSLQDDDEPGDWCPRKRKLLSLTDSKEEQANKIQEEFRELERLRDELNAQYVDQANKIQEEFRELERLRDELNAQYVDIPHPKRKPVKEQNTGHKMQKANDDTIREVFVHQYSDILKSVGLLISKSGMGTIFRVGSKYGMTAAHNINAIINPHKQTIGDDTQLSQEHVCVTFGESGAALTHKFKLSGKIPFNDEKLDVAVLEFVEDSNHPLPPPLSLLHYDVCSSLDDVAIVGFGHRNNDFKCLDHSVKVLDPEYVPVDASKEYFETHHKTLTPVLKCIGKDYRSVDAGYTGCKDPKLVLLNTCVGPGASGSPIFTKNDPGALKVVGVFTCGYPALKYELPSTIRYPMEWTFEAGTRMNCVYEEMKCSLKAELFSD